MARDQLLVSKAVDRGNILSENNSEEYTEHYLYVYVFLD